MLIPIIAGAADAAAAAAVPPACFRQDNSMSMGCHEDSLSQTLLRIGYYS